MDDRLISGIIYSTFDEIKGPMAKIVIPEDIEIELQGVASLKSVGIMAGEKNKAPESLAIIPFPSYGMKGIIKIMEIMNKERRGGIIYNSITVLFPEQDDLIFYKYINNFDEIFSEAAEELIQLEENKADIKEITNFLHEFKDDITQTINELKDLEITGDELEAFPDSEPKNKALQEDEKNKDLRHYRFKVIVCGDPAVGKTSTILRFTDKAFKRVYVPTLGTNISEKKIQINNNIINYIIWDIAGQSKFQKMRKHFYTGASGQLLIFDLTRPKTFENIINWFNDIKSNLNTRLHGFIIGNKKDLIEKREIPEKEVEEISEKLGLEYFETSALTGENVDEAFYKLGEILLSKLKIESIK
ncbi:MAG: GTP-binding protein [Candidatus Lokiarchaeota archaeon]|nr:GTP-binding protein [Candidatus Lokiarchaeota archaeon]